jgi:hypothetical protein
MPVNAVEDTSCADQGTPVLRVEFAVAEAVLKKNRKHLSLEQTSSRLTFTLAVQNMIRNYTLSLKRSICYSIIRLFSVMITIIDTDRVE